MPIVRTPDASVVDRPLDRRLPYADRIPRVDIQANRNGHAQGSHQRYQRHATDLAGRHCPHGIQGYCSRCYSHYPRGHYYSGYRPYYYPGYAYYAPLYGYSYVSAYAYEPYVTRIYDDGGYTVDRSYAPSPAAGQVVVDPSATQAATQPVEAAPAGGYQPLTEAISGSLVGEGNAAFAAGKYDDARRMYVRAVLADERDGYAKLLYAVANFALGDYELAATALRRALLTTPQLIDNPVDVRTLYTDPAALDAQLAALEAYVDARAADHEAMLLFGYLLFSRGVADRAASLFERLAAADPSDSPVSLLRDAAVRVRPQPPPVP